MPETEENSHSSPRFKKKMENEYLFQHGFKCALMCKGKTQDLKKKYLNSYLFSKNRVKLTFSTNDKHAFRDHCKILQKLECLKIVNNRQMFQSKIN